MHRVKEQMSVYQRECTGYVHTAPATHKKSKYLCILANNGPKGEAGMSGNDLIKTEEFMSQITDDDFNRLRSQIVTSNQRGGRRYLPYAFTEQDIAMLSAILRSETAIKVSNRFAIIDNTTVYHFGASLKDLGKKWFAFSKMDFGAVEMLTRLKEMQIDE